jgi:hypothetical protein
MVYAVTLLIVIIMTTLNKKRNCLYITPEFVSDKDDIRRGMHHAFRKTCRETCIEDAWTRISR